MKCPPTYFIFGSMKDTGNIFTIPKVWCVGSVHEDILFKKSTKKRGYHLETQCIKIPFLISANCDAIM